jgi:hypothetical protein
MLLTYEIVITLVFLAFLAWSIRSANACYLGALFGGYMLAGFDWIWCTAGFWNATFNSELTMIPGLNIQGVEYPFTIGFLWSIGFGFLSTAGVEILRCHIDQTRKPALAHGFRSGHFD